MKDYSNVVFPVYAKYKRHKNRIYFATDCKNEEKLKYYGKCEKYSSNANGYRHYMDSNGFVHLIHYNDIEEVKK